MVGHPVALAALAGCTSSLAALLQAAWDVDSVALVPPTSTEGAPLGSLAPSPSPHVPLAVRLVRTSPLTSLPFLSLTEACLLLGRGAAVLELLRWAGGGHTADAALGTAGVAAPGPGSGGVAGRGDAGASKRSGDPGPGPRPPAASESASAVASAREPTGGAGGLVRVA